MTPKKTEEPKEPAKAETTPLLPLNSKPFDPIEIYNQLSHADMTEFVEKTLKKHNYISWVEAVRAMLARFGYEFQWHVHEDRETGLPYFKTHWDGALVKVSVYVNGHARTQWHPVITHTNTPIKAPDTMAINNAIQRCLAKAIALHGLGLYIYAGEDLPPTDKAPDRTPEAQDRGSAAPQPPPPVAENVDDAVSRKAKVHKWIKGAVTKGISEEDAWLMFEGSRLATGHMDYDYHDTKNVPFDAFTEILNHFGATARDHIERNQ